VGKRSPILGYNHNVRYRGLVFHVQTEDSGVASPHLFTHLFHHGVIVSTRKLDYDAGSAEESIKSLMQAQHKAVLKDLRRGAFDDKIDSYLGGTPGLLPRGVEETAERPGEAELAPSTGAVEMVAGPPTEQVLPLILDEFSDPIILIEEEPTPPPSRPTPPPLPARVTERHSAQVAAASAGVTGPAAVPRAPASRGNIAAVERSETGSGLADGFAGAGGKGPRRSGRGIDTTIKTAVPAFELSEPDLSPEIEIHMLDDGDEAVTRARRLTRDTETQLSLTDQTRPTLSMDHDDPARPAPGGDELRRAPAPGDGAPGAIRPSSPSSPPPAAGPDSRRLVDRPSTIHAAALPPARPISRPASRPAMAPPQVVARPAADERHRRESEASDVYSPGPPSAELAQPQGERPGQYAQHKKAVGRAPLDGVKGERERSAGVPVPAGLGRPQRPGSVPSAKIGTGTPPPTAPPTPVPREARGSNHTEPVPREARGSNHTEPVSREARGSNHTEPVSREARGSNHTEPVPREARGSNHTEPVPREARGSNHTEPVPREARGSNHTEPLRGRVPTPARLPVTGRAGGGAGSGVVMTRPAVIVGAPQKAPGTVPRIRKAREDEGRGFGQGLISEKSLDEVILAYLSEDADEK
jgi:hypothetical protein